MFNGTQPSNEGCTNGVSIDGQVTIDCGQGTILIDCDQGYKDNADYSNLSNYFIWYRTDQQPYIEFRFYQQIKISRINMFFWNSPTDDITIPTVKMYSSDYNHDGNNIINNETHTIKTNSLNRTSDERHMLNFDVNNSTLQFQYLILQMNNSEWIFLSEVQFCGEYLHSNCDVVYYVMVFTGNQAPFHITQPSTDYDVQIVPPTATMANLTCSLNITIPGSVSISWVHNIDNPVPASESMQFGHSTTLIIKNLQELDAGIYQCRFFDDAAYDGSGWTLRRNIRLFITSMNSYISIRHSRSYILY